MYRIHKKNRDPQRAIPVTQCALCGGELYAGSSCWRLAGRTFCEGCVVPWLLGELECFHVRCGEVGR